MKQPAKHKSELEKRLEAQIAAEKAQSDEKTAPGPAPQAAGPDLDALQAERDELKDQVLRARAEFDNYRKRVARQAEQTRKTATEALMRDLLPVVDNIERALDHADDASGGLAEGIELVLKQMREVLGRHGVEIIPALGEPFDPNIHEAVMRACSDEYPVDLVAQECQRGYRIGSYVLRPAKVVVSGGPETLEDEQTLPPGEPVAEQQTDEQTKTNKA